MINAAASKQHDMKQRMICHQSKTGEITHVKVVGFALGLSLPVARSLQQPCPLGRRNPALAYRVHVVKLSSSALNNRENEEDIDETGKGEVCQYPSILP